MISIYLFTILLFAMSALVGNRIIFSNTPIDINASILSKNDSRYLRGVSALFVVFSHLFHFISESGVEINKYFLFITNQLGGIGVLIFFFVSGYGVFASYKEKTPSIKFIINRIKGVYIPYIVIKVVLLIYQLIKFGDVNVAKSLINIILVEDWFVHVILIKYVLFYLFWKFSNKKFFITTLVSDLVLSIIYILLDKPDRWFNALWLFTVGMLFCRLRSKIITFYNSLYWGKVISVFIVFVLFGAVFSVLKNIWWANPIKPIAGVFLCLSIVGLLKVVSLNNKVIMLIGDRSLYIYIVHLAIWNIITIENMVLKFWIVIGVTIVVVEVLYRLVGLLNSKNNGVKR